MDHISHTHMQMCCRNRVKYHLQLFQLSGDKASDTNSRSNTHNGSDQTANNINYFVLRHCSLFIIHYGEKTDKSCTTEKDTR